MSTPDSSSPANAAGICLPPGLPEEVYQLGTPTEEFACDEKWLKSQRRSLRWTCWTALLFFSVALVWVLADPGSPDSTVGASFLSLSGAVLYLGGRADWGMISSLRGTWILVCPGGLVQLQGEDVSFVRWSDVTAIFQPRERGGLWLRRAGGEPIVLDPDLPDLDLLRQICEGETLEYLLPYFLDRFEAGDVLRFGDLRISRQNVGDAFDITRLVSWDRIRAVQIRDKCLCFTDGKQRLSYLFVMDLGRIDNVHVVLALADHVLWGTDATAAAAAIPVANPLPSR